MSNKPSTIKKLFNERFLRQIDQLVLISKRARAGQMQGERRSPKRGQSVEFADYRQYSRGDDFRMIDWNVYARLETLFLKLFVEEEDITVHLLVDTSRSMDWGTPNKLFAAQQLAGALGYIALAGLDRVTASTFGGQMTLFPPRRGKPQAHHLFEYLLGLQASGTAELGTTLKRYAQGARNVGPLLLISDLFDATWEDGLRALLARRFDITVLHMLAPEELSPTLGGDLRLKDVERGSELEITVDAAMLQRYAQNLHAWQTELRRWCGARGISYATIDSSIPVEEITLNLLRQQGVVR
ncbi:MAG: DUF58 domain-containing protein [Ardenticatenaceae bacterium]